ncbi:MAG: hypothetical protein ABIW30_08335 [Arenimonas sp.]
MASTTLCFSGFSRDDVALAQGMFEQANAASGNRWSLVPEADAQVLVIDMDSMYGHMTWLKAQGSGKTTVGLTSGERLETDHMLKRPLTEFALKSLLGQLAGEQSDAAPAPAPTPAPAAPVPTVATAGPSAEYLAAVTTGQRVAMRPTVPHESRISDFLPPGVLGGPAKLQIPGAPVLALDPASQTYAGSASLKPLLPYLEAVVPESELTAIEASEFERIKELSGGAQPYMRLLWLCGLSTGKGELLPGYNTGNKFTLTKWPQIEREFPKHFRLATVMMKGPALVRELAETSGVAESDVVDFINAGLLTGAVVVEGSPSAAGDITRATALLARPRAG